MCKFKLRTAQLKSNDDTKNGKKVIAISNKWR